MSDQKTLEKELKIKSGVLKRYLQEVEYYRKEVHKQTDKINSMKAEPEPDQYMIKKAAEVLQENQNMVTLSVQNVKKAAAELKSWMEGAKDRWEQMDEKQREIAEELIGRVNGLPMD